MFSHLFPKVFRISAVQVMFIIILGLLSLAISNRIAIAEKFSNVTPQAREVFSAQVESIDNNKVIGSAILVITWAGVGLVVYTVIWIGMLILTEARNEIVVETEYVNRGPLSSRLKIPLIQVGLLILVLLLLALSLNNLFGFWSGFFAEFLWRMNIDYLGAILNLFYALLGISLNVYVIKVVIATLISIE